MDAHTPPSHHSEADQPAVPHSRALVLGGGGSTGNAWLIGVLAGLHEGGLDPRAADLVIGTSAGSTAAAQLGGAAPAALYADILAAEATAPQHTPQHLPRRPPHTQPVGPSPVNRIQRVIDAAGSLAEMRVLMGAAARDLDINTNTNTDAGSSWQSAWHDTVASRLPSQEWPAGRVWLTAVDANTGEPVVLDRDSGVSLTDAVAASCSSGRPYRIGDSAYIDGGFRTNAENADLAAGYERVLVLSPFGGKALTPVEWGTHLTSQADHLRAGGSRVEIIAPAATDEHLFGENAMRGWLRPEAARVGYAQGVAHAEVLAEFWGITDSGGSE